jgi:hypothetical protein
MEEGVRRAKENERRQEADAALIKKLDKAHNLARQLLGATYDVVNHPGIDRIMKRAAAKWNATAEETYDGSANMKRKVV